MFHNLSKDKCKSNEIKQVLRSKFQFYLYIYLLYFNFFSYLLNNYMYVACPPPKNGEMFLFFSDSVP